MELLPFVMFIFLLGVLLTGYPVAFSIGGTAFLFGLLAFGLGALPVAFFSILPSRIFGIMQNLTLIAVPLFIFMGLVLSRSGVAEELLKVMSMLCGRLRGGLAISIILVGALLAASTGIVGATVVTMTLISLPVMLKYKYDKSLSCGIIASSGTLGQIVPPSVVLILLSDVFSRTEVSTGKLFMAAVVPSMLLIIGYITYVLILAYLKPNMMPKLPASVQESYAQATKAQILGALLPPLVLILAVLGSIFTGIATPTESAAVGAVGAVLIASFKAFGKRNKTTPGLSVRAVVWKSAEETVVMTSMIFLILIAAQAFGLIFRGLGGDEIFTSFFADLEWSRYMVLLVLMLMVFLLGFFLDFVEIAYIFVPLLVPILIDHLGFDPLWIAILLALNLQTSFLTPPLGFSLFYLKGAAPPGITTSHIYKGVIPFIGIQLFVLLLVVFFPVLVTWLPKVMV